MISCYCSLKCTMTSFAGLPESPRRRKSQHSQPAPSVNPGNSDPIRQWSPVSSKDRVSKAFLFLAMWGFHKQEKLLLLFLQGNCLCLMAYWCLELALLEKQSWNIINAFCWGQAEVNPPPQTLSLQSCQLIVLGIHFLYYPPLLPLYRQDS